MLFVASDMAERSTPSAHAVVFGLLEELSVAKVQCKSGLWLDSLQQKLCIIPVPQDKVPVGWNRFKGPVPPIVLFGHRNARLCCALQHKKTTGSTLDCDKAAENSQYGHSSETTTVNRRQREQRNGCGVDRRLHLRPFMMTTANASCRMTRPDKDTHTGAGGAPPTSTTS